jgi:predicted membrane channel-forming protein YqfA (hemolysin III family)
VKRPRGFTILAVILGLGLVGELMELADRQPGLRHDAIGAVLAILAMALSAVAIEALWRFRPWATRAVAALAVVGFVASLASDLAEHNGVLGSVFSAVVLIMIVRYVDSRVRAAHGPAVVPRVRRPVPWRRP